LGIICDFFFESNVFRLGVNSALEEVEEGDASSAELGKGVRGGIEFGGFASKV